MSVTCPPASSNDVCPTTCRISVPVFLMRTGLALYEVMKFGRPKSDKLAQDTMTLNLPFHRSGASGLGLGQRVM